MHRYQHDFSPVPNPSSVVGGHDTPYRITVLADGLVRLEWSPTHTFEDRASTFAVHRNLTTPKFRVTDGKTLELSTDRFRLSYDKKKFSATGLTIQVLGSMTNYDSLWRYGQKTSDLGGTARTLDEVDGRTDLGPAVISRAGYAVIDDSESMLFDHTGWVSARNSEESIDLYVFAYGHDYRAAIRALYSLSGPQPLLPRSVLGNWWSRYYAYSEKEYLDLMDRFKAEDIPLSVAVLDMDWHLVKQDVCKRAGVSGWTGYTWDETLFPDPARFGREIRKRGLMLTLNDHPADGIHSYEDHYQAMALAVDHDTSSNDPIPFDITDRTFCDAFFDILHHEIEEAALCDFWWIDWQQGSFSKTPGVDPLWMLNHFHYLDNTRPDRQPLTFSRFAGPGSHRYPVGFSGDSIVSWDSLNFQPEFTNCASNIGYGWWSHDIGGHMHGTKDDELQTRWLQYGVFSPIMRLHSTANLWNSKEPWNYASEHAAVQTQFLKLRHRLVPYIQTMNILAAQEGGLPLCQPMYWSHPEADEAYDVPNQYLFGNNLVVAPITSPRNVKSKLGRVKAWLPPGLHVDIFTGIVYEGGGMAWLHRTLHEFPVLAPAGTIIPLDGSQELQNGCNVPKDIELLLVPGADATFELLEDQPHKSKIASTANVTKTTIKYSHATGKLSIAPASAAGPFDSRNWTVRVIGCQKIPELRVKLEDRPISSPPACTYSAQSFLFSLHEIPTDKELEVTFGADQPQNEALMLALAPCVERCKQILAAAQVEYDLKERVWKVLQSGDSSQRQASRLNAIEMEETLRDALLELVCAC